MSDGTVPTPPPLPEQPAAEAARAPGGQPAYNPATDPDDTGVPTVGRDVSDIGEGFLRALFDISFRTFITRRLAGVFYVVGLVAIAIGFLVYFIGGIVNGILAIVNQHVGAGISLIVATIVLVPIVTFLTIVALRFVIESVVALIAIAENTERTAANTRH